MTISTKSPWNPKRLDVKAFALAAGQLSASEGGDPFERLQAERAPGTELEPVRWHVQGEMRVQGTGKSEPWVHLLAETALWVVCQRCLRPVRESLLVDRWYRFVADEATAEAEDEDCEEDVLSLEPRPDLMVLVEDELLMALPLVPMHEVCPEPVVMEVADDGALPGADETPRKNPFAELARLKK